MNKLNIIALVVLIAFAHRSNSNSERRALIYGVTGQDGTYLTEFLLSKGYTVFGVARNSEITNNDYLQEIIKKSENKIKLIKGDITDEASVYNLIKEVKPHEIYNLAAQSHVALSFNNPVDTAKTNSLGTLYILEAIRTLNLHNSVRVFQAVSAEMFGKDAEVSCDENTSFQPTTPYGVSKLFAYWITNLYKKAYNIFACNGILFNHESPLRCEKFVTRTITKGVAQIFLGIKDKLLIGNLDARRDWGHAKDYVEAMWLMLQHERPEDFVIATGETHSVREFIEAAFSEIGLEIGWKGTGIHEIGYDKKTGKELVFINPAYYRPLDLSAFYGNCAKALKLLNWSSKIKFRELVKTMMESDLQAMKKCR